MSEYTISAKSRNLGFGWTNRPVQFYNSRGDGYLGFKLPVQIKDRRGIRGVEEERSQAVKLNQGNDWTGALYVNGQRVDAWYAPGDGWMECGKFELSLILELLRDGRSIDVRTVEGD